MATTNFVDKTTVIEPAWLNDVDATVYQALAGATTAAEARTALGLVIGTDVQAWDAQLDDIAALAVTDGNIIVGDGANWVAESGATARASLGLTIGTDVQAYDAGLAYLDGLNFTNEATFKSGVNLEIGTDVQAYDANNAVTDAAQTFTAGQRATITTLTDQATITPDMADGNDFTVTLGGNRTLANPSNITAGQSGVFYIVQDGTGSRTLSYGTYYDFEGGTAPTLTTTADAYDVIAYTVRTTTSISCKWLGNFS